MSVERILNGHAQDFQQGVWQIGVDVCEGERVGELLAREETWRENSRTIRQESISRGSLPLVIDTITRRTNIEDLPKQMNDNLLALPDTGIQVYETLLTERDMEEREEKNNRVKAFLRKKSKSKILNSSEESGYGEVRLVQYNLVIFTRNRLDLSRIDLCRVEVTCEVVPTIPATHSILTSRQRLRYRALTELLADSSYKPRQVTGRLDPVIVWREGRRLPPIHVLGTPATDLKLTRLPSTERGALGLAELRREIQQLARVSGQLENEILTRLEDSVLGNGTWEIQVHKIWSLPRHDSQFTFVIAVFLKGGLYYKCELGGLVEGCRVEARYLDPAHLDILTISCIRKLKEDFKDLDLRLELPGGRDVNKIPLPGLVAVSQSLAAAGQSSPAVNQPGPTAAGPTAETRSLLGWFSKGNTSTSPVIQNNLTNNRNTAGQDGGGSPTATPPILIDNIDDQDVGWRAKGLARQMTLVEDPSLFGGRRVAAGEASNTNTGMDTLKVPGDSSGFPDRLKEQSYRKISASSNKTLIESAFEKKSPAVTRSISVRKLSSCLEPHEPPGETLPLPVPTNPQPRPVLSRAPSVVSGQSQDSRRSSVIMDMREAISESGKRLSLIVAENQSRALQALLEDIQGSGLSTKRKLVYASICLFACLFCFYVLVWIWEGLVILRDGLFGEMSQLSGRLTSMEQLVTSMEQVVNKLHDRDVSTQLDRVMEQIQGGMEGNTLKFAIMERLVGELTAIEHALAHLQNEVSKSQSCGWSPLNMLSTDNE